MVVEGLTVVEKTGVWVEPVVGMEGMVLECTEIVELGLMGEAEFMVVLE
jgi:hypothetical protein